MDQYQNRTFVCRILSTDPIHDEVTMQLDGPLLHWVHSEKLARLKQRVFPNDLGSAQSDGA